MKSSGKYTLIISAITLSFVTLKGELYKGDGFSARTEFYSSYGQHSYNTTGTGLFDITWDFSTPQATYNSVNFKSASVQFSETDLFSPGLGQPLISITTTANFTFSIENNSLNSTVPITSGVGGDRIGTTNVSPYTIRFSGNYTVEGPTEYKSGDFDWTSTTSFGSIQEGLLDFSGVFPNLNVDRIYEQDSDVHRINFLAASSFFWQETVDNVTIEFGIDDTSIDNDTEIGFYGTNEEMLVVPEVEDYALLLGVPSVLFCLLMRRNGLRKASYR